MSQESVVLVNDNNQPIGTALKSQVHTDKTPLHRGFSVFLFNSKGDLLLQQRARHKKTWPGVWSNSCCGHPAPDETPIEAARRRVYQELGLAVDQLVMILPDYRYHMEREGVVENEICPVMAALSDQTPRPNPGEVTATRWVKWRDFLNEIKKPNDYSGWCVEEALLLGKSAKFKKWYSSMFSRR